MIFSSKLSSLLWVGLVSLTAGACLDPQVSDDLAPKGLLLPAGSFVPSAHDDPEIEKRIADNDGVDGVVPLLSGFANDQQAQYWDFGEAPDFAAPIFILAKANAQGDLEPIDHKVIVDTIPGDAGYSPFWAALFVEVTDSYDGELITSVAALEEAQELGLVKAPLLPTFAVNCPTVSDDVRLEVGGGQEPVAAPSDFFWQGQTVHYFDLGKMPLTAATTPDESPIYVLSRQGQVPLSEPIRGVDITGDGDISDTNNVFALSKRDANYTPLCHQIDVIVPASSLSLIDTTGSETASAIRKATDLFDPSPVVGNVIAFDDTGVFGNCPQQSEVGGL